MLYNYAYPLNSVEITLKKSKFYASETRVLYNLEKNSASHLRCTAETLNTSFSPDKLPNEGDI